jgi:hypothetical protein
MKTAWEYQVRQFGNALRSVKPEEVEAFLNEAVLDGWELGEMAAMSGGNRLLVILRRKTNERPASRSFGWP